MRSERSVAIASTRESVAYPGVPPFLPGEAYPELAGRVAAGGGPNVTYELLRRLLFALGMDVDRFATPEWNPLSEIIQPGQKVLIKPNLVRHLHLGGGDYQTVVTHPSLVRAVLDYVALALKGDGEITVGDAPVQSTDFAKLVERTSLRQICEDVSKAFEIPVRLVDFRLWSVEMDDRHRIESGGSLDGDSRGYPKVDLGRRSLLCPLAEHSERFRVTNYDNADMPMHHNRETNEYLIPGTVLEADVVINLPKLKTHRKVGLTAALKNLVGINGYKDWLPHHRIDSPSEGGDEYKHSSSLKRFQSRLRDDIDRNPYSKANRLRWLLLRANGQLIKRFSRDRFLEGSWYGNDTLWRTVLDLNRLLVYADANGTVTESRQRTTLTIVDGVIAGEGEGPMKPDPRPCGLLVGGGNPVAVDAVLATLIGFDYRKIPLISNGFLVDDLPLIDCRPEDIEIVTDDERWKALEVGDACDSFCFKPSSGWMGHIESSKLLATAK